MKALLLVPVLAVVCLLAGCGGNRGCNDCCDYGRGCCYDSCNSCCNNNSCCY